MHRQETGDRRPGSDVWTFLATVGGLGYLPLAPGTWGSLVGLLLGALAVRSISQLAMWFVLVATFVSSALICTKAERSLGQHDPPAVILDEVWGMAAVTVVLPSIASSWVLLLAAFLLFRIFDIVKPPPLRRLATLPAGWGILADDAGAAAYTILIYWLIFWLILDFRF